MANGFLEFPVTALVMDWGIILVIDTGRKFVTAVYPHYATHRMDQRVHLTWGEIMRLSREVWRRE